MEVVGALKNTKDTDPAAGLADALRVFDVDQAGLVTATELSHV